MFYADTSFLMRLLSNEVGSETAVGIFRSLSRPPLAFTSMHQLEVRNGLRTKAFMEKKSLPSAKKSAVDAALASWEGRLERFLQRGTFQIADVPWEDAVTTALALSQKFGLRLGTRAFDTIHVALGMELKCRQFITCDLRQAALAKAAGLKVTMVEAI